MLLSIHAQNVSALGEVTFEPAERVTLVTGENGLGKTLLLDLAWFAATGGNTARAALTPRRPGDGAATIRYTASVADGVTSTVDERFDARTWRWERDSTPWATGLVVYAHADGAFDVWDFMRTARHVSYDSPDVRRIEHRFALTPGDVWDGLTRDGRVLCNGLLRDWATWQFQRPDVFARFARALARLSEGLDESLLPGTPQRVSPDDARDIPTLRLPYGEVPVSLCSAGMRRVLALAYIIVWTFDEHRAAAQLMGEKPLEDLVLLVDEVEAHLHPRWQRLLLPALLAVLDELAPSVHAQVIATTHAPLVLASIEPHFSPTRDRLLHLARAGAGVELTDLPWSPQGDAVNWLVSESFGLRQARSIEAEQAIEAAEAFMRGEPCPAPLDQRDAIHEALRAALPDHDHFWPRWLVRSGAVASALMNASKKARAVLDPYEVGADWFEVVLPSMELVARFERIPADRHALVRATLATLPLVHDERIVRQRREWYAMFCAGELSIEGLGRVAPQIAAAVERWQREHPGVPSP
jgi:hypothetical protein